MPVLVAVAALAVTTAGCGGQPDRAQPPGSPAAVSPAASPPPRTSEPGDVKQLTIRVTNGRVEPPPGRVAVRQGQRIRLTVSSDRADEVHVHLYDRYQPVPAGGSATIEFRADVAGVAEVELERAHKQLVQLVVQ